MSKPPYWSKKETGKTLHEIYREEHEMFPMSSVAYGNIEAGQRQDEQYRPICEAQGKIYVRGHKFVSDEGKVFWVVGHCRRKR